MTPTTKDPTMWGYWLDADTWRELPKQPLRLAGLTQPPFQVTRPDGTVVDVVDRERDQQPAA